MIFHHVGLMSEQEDDTVAWAAKRNGVMRQCIIHSALAEAPTKS